MPTFTVGTGKTYATISLAIAALPADLTGLGVHLIEVYEGGSHEGDGYFYDEAVSIAGITTTQNDYVHIQAMSPCNGIKNNGIVIRHSAGVGVVTISTPYTRFTGFGVTATGDAQVDGIQIYAPNCLVDKCIVYELGSNAVRGILLGYAGVSVVDSIVRNCVVCDLSSAVALTTLVGIAIEAPLMQPTAAIVANCSILNINHSVQSAFNYGISVVSAMQPSTATIYNTVVACNASQPYGDIATSGMSATITLYNCASSDGTADDFLGSDNLVDQDVNTDIMFVNSLFGSSDARFLTRLSSLFDAGVETSPLFMPPGYEYYEDITGLERPQGELFDIGAFELRILGFYSVRAPRAELKHTIVSQGQINQAYNC